MRLTQIAYLLRRAFCHFHDDVIQTVASRRSVTAFGFTFKQQSDAVILLWRVYDRVFYAFRPKCEPVVEL